MNHALMQRYAGPITGAFVVGILLTLFAIVLVAGSRGGWLAATVPITITLPEEGAFGLRQGAEIQALGIVIGNVTSIQVVEDRIVAHGWVREDLAQMVAVRAPVRIKKTLLIGGDTYLEIGRASGVTFGADEPIKLTATTDPPIENLPAELQNTLATITATARAYEQIAKDLQDPGGRYQRILAAADTVAQDLQTLSSALEETDAANVLVDLRGRVTRMVSGLDELLAVATEGARTATATMRGIDDQLAYLPELAEDSAETIELVQGNLTELKDVIRSLQSITHTLSDELQDAPGALLQVRSTLREVEDLSRALRQSWLVNGPDGSASRRVVTAEEALRAVDLVGPRP
ncbi:hypothetical protein [Mucisphaera sp.]|uniref:hypothetical protein n=1 Tax=Mucisphaera sp. TaxID=2913024 RepID=UPI003D116828